jgi:hypothetical protein
MVEEYNDTPITFTSSGRVYRFRGEASFGTLVGEAGVYALWYRYGVMRKVGS